MVIIDVGNDAKSGMEKRQGRKLANEGVSSVSHNCKHLSSMLRGILSRSKALELSRMGKRELGCLYTTSHQLRLPPGTEVPPNFLMGQSSLQMPGERSSGSVADIGSREVRAYEK